MFDDELVSLATEVLDRARAKGIHLASAESCTGGLIMGCLTEIAGSSDVVDRGFITYTNRAKMEVLGVPADIIRDHGAVSEACARAMANGALAASSATIAVAVTGVAGPGGGSVEKPVGLVHFAASLRGGETRPLEKRFGDIGRSNVRRETVHSALNLYLELIELV
ncbi:CinA family protein [Emcibacter nanhaiensis]|uniref:CinA family protein n=1 Tax=Emcibacter nanhaiensis TaxID=1505037 RepID=A0A501PSI8_9PROT|nr:CinA family protein [Emcibacter nanhaiensis]TPD63057.1 CinA family protein [Emcibacter nanhaiensis]